MESRPTGRLSFGQVQGADALPGVRAFSGKVDATFEGENATERRLKAFVLMQSKRETL